MKMYVIFGSNQVWWQSHVQTMQPILHRQEQYTHLCCVVWTPTSELPTSAWPLCLSTAYNYCYCLQADLVIITPVFIIFCNESIIKIRWEQVTILIQIEAILNNYATIWCVALILQHWAIYCIICTFAYMNNMFIYLTSTCTIPRVLTIHILKSVPSKCSIYTALELHWDTRS